MPEAIDLIQRVVGQGVAQKSLTPLQIPFVPPGVRIGARMYPPADYHSAIWYGIHVSPEIVPPNVWWVWMKHLNISEHGPILVCTDCIVPGTYDFFGYITAEEPAELWIRHDWVVGLPFYGQMYHLNIKTPEEMAVAMRIVEEATGKTVGLAARKANIPSFLPKVTAEIKLEA